MEVLDFCSKHIQQAKRLIRENYQEERQAVPVLPTVGELPGLDELAENGLGCAAFEKGEMVGFLACLNPWENAFTTTARGTFSPIFAHGAVRSGRAQIYQRLYQAAAQKWADAGISSHSIGLYAHDHEAVGAFFQYGFGLYEKLVLLCLSRQLCQRMDLKVQQPESNSKSHPLYIVVSPYLTI